MPWPPWPAHPFIRPVQGHLRQPVQRSREYPLPRTIPGLDNPPPCLVPTGHTQPALIEQSKEVADLPTRQRMRVEHRLGDLGHPPARLPLDLLVQALGVSPLGPGHRAKALSFEQVRFFDLLCLQGLEDRLVPASGDNDVPPADLQLAADFLVSRIVPRAVQHLARVRIDLGHQDVDMHGRAVQPMPWFAMANDHGPLSGEAELFRQFFHSVGEHAPGGHLLRRDDEMAEGEITPPTPCIPDHVQHVLLASPYDLDALVVLAPEHVVQELPVMQSRRLARADDDHLTPCPGTEQYPDCSAPAGISTCAG